MPLAIRWMLLLNAGLLLAIAGCAGYQLGSASLYNPNIRTIYIPIIRNETFRHDLGVQLTEALQKEVELRTPYKVVANPSADSTLTCRVTAQTKRVIVEANTDEPRALENMISVELTWTDRQGNLLLENRFVPQGELAFFFIQGSDFVPEGAMQRPGRNGASFSEFGHQDSLRMCVLLWHERCPAGHRSRVRRNSASSRHQSAAAESRWSLANSIRRSNGAIWSS